MLNCIILQGRLKNAPELRQTQTGISVATATIAVSRNRKDASGEYKTDWIDLVFWGKTADHASRWFGKGDMAVVRGRLESRDWEDKNGNKRRSWEVHVESIDFCFGKRESSNNYAPEYDARAVQEVDDFAEIPDDSIVPF